jgi:DNA-binding transcriptional MerR regulator
MGQLDHAELAHQLIQNEGEVIGRLRLSAAEAARVCNVTPRQLIYWTKKGIIRPSPHDEHDYDIFAIEKVIRIRQALEKGSSLEKAAQHVDREMAAQRAEFERVTALTAEELEEELRRRLEGLEERVHVLRRTLPSMLTLARLRRAIAALDRLENSGSLQSSTSNGDTAKALAMRLSRAVDELESLLREVQPAPA